MHKSSSLVATCHPPRGVHAGTVSGVNRFDIDAGDAKRILTAAARHDTSPPPGIATLARHATTSDGMPGAPVAFGNPGCPGP